MQSPNSAMKGAARPDLDQKPSRTAAIVFISIIVGALIYMVFSLQQDLSPFAIVNTLNFRYISETINQYHPFDFSAGFF